jgi:hypothetical protein
MALVLADRVQETTTTTGTGTITLAGAVSGFQSFAAVGNANTTYYTIAGQTTSEFEVGIGTYTTSGTTLSRDTILTSSNSNLAVNFSAGTKNVFVTYPASRSVYANGTTLTASNSSVLPVGSGGTGITTTPTNGQLLVGNGTNYTVATLGSGTGISTTTGAGTLTVNNTGVTSNVAGTGISVSGATGAVTITNSGVTSNVAGTGVTVSGATGAVTVSIGQAVATSSNVQFNSLGVGTAGSATAGEIRATNNVTAFYTSDVRFKENVQAITGAGEIIRSIGGDYFDWTEEYIAEHGGEDGYFVQKSDFGVIAQKVQKVFPKAVRVKPDGTLAVDYEKLGILAFPAIADMLDRLDAIEAKLKVIANKL